MKRKWCPSKEAVKVRNEVCLKLFDLFKEMGADKLGPANHKKLANKFTDMIEAWIKADPKQRKRVADMRMKEIRAWVKSLK